MEDNFRMGIQVREGGVKLFSNFDRADVIVAAPLGLRLIVGSEGDRDRYIYMLFLHTQIREFHFLSSIEVLIIDRASAIAM
jgi:U3 small nucleolar RNA-associated protein 25